MRRLALAGGAAACLAAGMPPAQAAATFDPNLAPSGWSTRPVLTSNSLKSGTEVVFRAEYKAGLWTGTVKANYINALGEVQGTSPWTGSETANILATTNWNTGRKIVTRTTAGTGVAFRYTSLDSTQQTALGGATAGANLVNYVRGDRTNETPSGTKLRARNSVQGDIKHSTLLHWRHTSGPRRLYVGGNDGMLHVFDAATGSEVFAYVPSMLISRLPALATTTYDGQLWVDGGLAMADVSLSGSTRTLLAGALGGGGRGLFMLDVTSPTPADEAAAASTIKWEISSATTGFANLGFTYAAPRLARLNNNVAAVVVGNGYVNTGNGQASLFIINADTGALIREISTASGSTASPNGLSTATLVDTDLDGKVDYAYAGDIDGNVWVFNLLGSNTANWSVSKLHTTSPAQAITTAPVVAKHPLGGRMVMFATGRVLTTADNDTNAAHFAYGIWEAAPGANTSWLDQTVTELTSGTQRLRRVSNNAPNWASGGHRGWRLTLGAGERVIGEAPFVIDDRLYFTTTNPTVSAVTDGQASGANWLMEVNFLTGGSPAAAIFDINEDGAINSTDNLGGGVIVGKYLGAGIASQPVLADLAAFSLTLFNQQSDLDYSLPTGSTDAGVSGGHFDVDVYGFVGSTFDDIKHIHEYDDKYDVTGVNFLNASETTYNLSNRITSTTQAFKVLVANQYLNPASTLSVGGGGYVSVKDYGGLATAATATAALAGLPSYTRGTTTPVGTLAWKLPLDAFKSKDWWGDGQPARAGLIPTQTGCVKSVDSDGGDPGPGPNGERHNGALTIQIIKADTPASDIELNWAAGGAKYGWRLKKSAMLSRLLAEYTMFWHHPNGKCYGDVGWVANAPEDLAPSKAKAATRASGSADPTDGAFVAAPAGVTVSSTSTTVSGNVTTIVVTYSDGKKETTVITVNDSTGTETVTMTDRAGTTSSGTRMSSGALGQANEEVLQGSRRLNWREVVRP